MIFYRIATREKKETVRSFVEKESLHMPVLLDGNGKVERLFGVWMHPTTFLIDRESRLCYRVMGGTDWTGMQATGVIDEMLKGR